MSHRSAFFAAAVTALATSIFAFKERPKDDVDENLELLMTVEISRHCEREPHYIFDLAANPEDNFTVPMNCTDVGVKHHHKNGAVLRKLYNQSTGFISETYNPEEVYT